MLALALKAALFEGAQVGMEVAFTPVGGKPEGIWQSWHYPLLSQQDNRCEPALVPPLTVTASRVFWHSTAFLLHLAFEL